MSKLFLTPQQLNNMFNDSQDRQSGRSQLHSSPVSYNDVLFEKDYIDEEKILLKDKINLLEQENKLLKQQLILQVKESHGSCSSQTTDNITGFYQNRTKIKSIKNIIENGQISIKTSMNQKEDYFLLKKENESLKKNVIRLSEQIQSVKDTLKQFSDLNTQMAQELKQIKAQSHNDQSKIPKTNNQSSFSILQKKNIPPKMVGLRPPAQRTSFSQDKHIQIQSLNGITQNSHSFQVAGPRAMTPTPIINKIFNKNISIIPIADLMSCGAYYNK